MSNVVLRGRISYAHIFEPHAMDGQDPKYSLSLIISKDQQDCTCHSETAMKIVHRMMRTPIATLSTATPVKSTHLKWCSAIAIQRQKSLCSAMKTACTAAASAT